MAANDKTTSLLLFDTDPQPLVASVISADATATAYLLNCPAGTDSNNCGTYNESITLGPWAQPTPPPGAPKTGFYDVNMVMPGEGFTFSVHCSMSGTVAQACTTVNIGGNNDGTPTVTYNSPPTSVFDFSYMPVTITAGLDKLSAAASSQASGEVTLTGTHTPSATGSTTTASGSASPAKTSSPANVLGGQGVGNVALLSVVLAWLFR